MDIKPHAPIRNMARGQYGKIYKRTKDQGEKLRSLLKWSREERHSSVAQCEEQGAAGCLIPIPRKKILPFWNAPQAMLEKAMDAGQNCKNWKEALTYLQEDCSRKIGQTKLFADIKAGRLRKQPDRFFQTARP